MKLGEKLKQLRITNGMSQAELGKKIGMTAQAISSWERGKTDIDIKKLSEICEILGTDADEFLGINKNTDKRASLFDLVIPDEDQILRRYAKLDKHGKDAVKLILEHELARVENGTGTNRAYIYPLVDEIQTVEIDYYPQSAGMGKGQDVIPSFPEKLEMSIDKVPEYTDYVIRVTGDSMMPTYYPGDLLFIQRTDHLNPGDIGVFVLEGETMVKELGKGELISHNKKYEPITKAESCIIQGRVLGKYTK